MFFRGNCNFKQGRSDLAPSAHSFLNGKQLPGMIAAMMLSLIPYTEVWASATPTTTTGNATQGAIDYVNAGCTGCHTSPTTPYPSQLNAANSGSMVTWENGSPNFMGAIPAASSPAAQNNIAAYIATFATTPTTVSTGYNTTSASTATNIILGSGAVNFYTDALTTIGVTGTSPAKGTVTFTAPTTGTTASTYTYTPTTGACGSDTFSYAAWGTDSTSLRTITVTIGNPPAPTIGGTPVAGTYMVTSTLFTPAVTNTNQSPTLCGATRYSATNVGYGGVYTTTTTGWPAGVSLNTSTGVISGTPTAAGSYSVTVYVFTPGGAASVPLTLTINKANQTLTFSPPPTITVGIYGTGTVSATSSAGLTPVTYSATGGCTVNSSTGLVTGTAAGTNNCAITASQAGNANYNSATQNQTLSIGKGTQTVAFGTAPTVVYGGTGTVTATASSGLAVTYSATGGCTVNATTGQVTGTAAGTNNCSITATQGGDANYLSASNLQTFSIGQASQALSWSPTPPASLTVNGSSTLGAVATSTLTATYSSLTLSVCTVTGNIVTAVATGTCKVAADQAGNTNYLAATQITYNIAVGLNTQTITFGAAPTVIYGGTGTVTATASSGLAVTYSSLTPAACSVNASSGLVSGLAAGTNNCTIAADQAGNATYAAAPQATQTISIGQASQIIAFGAAPSVAVGSTGIVTATATSTLAVTYSSLTTSVCTITGSTVTGVSSGTCTIAANQAGNANYLAAPQVTQSITVGKGSQTITFGAAPAVSVNGTGTVTATASSTLTVTYSTTTAATCSVNATTGLVSGIAAGTCTIAANQAGDANYLAAPQVTQSFIIGQASQAITFAAAPAITFGGTGTVKATASSGLAVSYSSLTASVCSVNVSSGVVSGLTTGTCTVAANQAGNANYAAAPQVTQSIAISQASQTITFGAAPTVAVGGTGTENATGGASGNPVIFTSLTTGVCTVSGTNGSTVNGVTKGTCTIAANQAGNASYAAAAQVTQNISVALLPPTANAATMSVQLNTPATLDLAPFVTGTTTSGINIAVAPAHGAAIVSGTKVTYTPANNYFGTDTFQYVAYGPGGTSSPATVTVTIIGRPDPTKDINVPSLINLQTETAKRFHQAQMFNFQQRMESLHHVIQADVATSYASRNRAMEMAGDVASLGDANLPPSASQPVSAAQSDSPMQTSGPSNAPGQNNDSPGVLSSVLLANSVVSVLTTSSLNLNLASLTNSGKPNGSGGLKIWGAGNLRYGTKNQPGGGSNIDFSTNGVSIGADQRFSDQLTLGMGIGYARDKNTIGTDGTGSTSTGNSVAAYASYQGSSTMFIDGLLGYGTLSMDTTRYVAPINDFARSNRSGNQTYGSLATGYEYRDEGMLLSPYARYDLGTDRLKAATETGAGLYALNYASQSTRSQQISLGFRAESQHQIDAGTAQPRVRIEYQHHIEGAGQTSIAYADLISTRYNLTIPTTNSNSVVLGIGSGFALHSGLSLDIDYQRQHSTGHENSQAFNFRLSKYLD